MGFGFPSAIGAQIGNPNKLVVSISGDGGFQMTLSELATAAIYKLPVKAIVLDNKYLGMVRQWQELFFDNRLSGVDLEGNPVSDEHLELAFVCAVGMLKTAQVAGKGLFLGILS